MRKIFFVAQKEFFHVLRDPRSLTIALIMPIMMTFLYGYAVNLDINDLTLAVIDKDLTADSRALIDRFYASAYFHPPKKEVDKSVREKILKEGDADVVLVINSGFAKALARREKFELGLVIDGSDNVIGTAVKRYSEQVINKYLLDTFSPVVDPPGIRISSQILYNQDLKSSHFFVPGLIAVILMMISALLTSITIAREKETGTMEQLLMCPISPREIIIGKIVPYIVIALADGILILVLAKILFDVPFAGSKILLLAMGLIYIFTALAMGILISSLVKTQQVAMMLAQTTTLLPSVMLSGYIFAIKNMPVPLQVISHIVPARYFLKIIRGIMLKGTEIQAILNNVLALVALAVVMIIIAARKFSTKVV